MAKRKVVGATAPTESPATIEPVTVSIEDAARITGESTRSINRQLAAGEIQAVKSGRRTLILMSSIKARIAALPRATFRPQQAA